MKTICYYAVATHLGGGERSLLELVRGLQARPELGYRPWVLLPRDEGPLVDKLREAGVDYEVLAIPQSFFQMSRGAPVLAFQQGLRSLPGMGVYLTRLMLLLRKHRPFALHTNAIKCHALAAIVGPAGGIPVIWHLRDILREGPTLWTLRALHKTSRVRLVANSGATAECFGPGLKKGGITVIHNGLSPDTYQPRRNRRFNELLGVPPETPMVGIVGVLARWKGQMEFLQMAERLVRAGSDARFVVVGGEIYDTAGEKGVLHALREEARRLGILERVLFTGHIDDPVEAINGLDVLVHASIRPEPFGRVVIEGMACAVAVVAAADGGVLEIVDDARTGLLFQPGNIDSMSRAVSRLVEEPAMRKAIAQRGRDEFLERFTSRRYVEAVTAYYDSLGSAG